MKKYLILSKLTLTISLFFALINATPVLAQKHAEHDTSFYDIFWHHVTARLYMAQKYTHFTIPPDGGGTDLQYVANPKLNLGIGATWHNLSLNVFYGFGYLNNKAKPKGNTKGLDLQVHLFPRKWVIDLYVVMPKGFHLNPKGFATTPGNYYYRDSIKERIFGFNVLRCPNKEKFSYRAALLQNEWQKKSAGSLLYGLHAFYVIMESSDKDETHDHLIVPNSVAGMFPKMAGISETRFFSLGPAFGGAYTLVLKKHWFLMGSALVGLNVNLMTEEHGETDWRKNTNIEPTVEYKAALGYNSPTWAFSASITGNNFWAKGVSTQQYTIMGGQMKFAVTKKIDTKKKHRGK